MNENFLIVDDDVDGIYLAKWNLQKSFPGATIDAADCGTAALLMLGRKAYSAMITDYQMNVEMDGIELIRRARAAGHRMPMIVWTAMDDMEQRAIEAGADHVLNWDQVGKIGPTVKRLLDRSATTAA